MSGSQEGQRRELVEAAIAALDRSNPANPPDRKFGAALRTKAGNVYASSAFWSETLSLALHAEQAAIAHAAAHGEREIVTLACVSTEDAKGEQYCHPCGICKQLLYESSRDSGIDIEILMANLKGNYLVKRVSEITPYPWPAGK